MNTNHIDPGLQAHHDGTEATCLETDIIETTPPDTMTVIVMVDSIICVGLLFEITTEGAILAVTTTRIMIPLATAVAVAVVAAAGLQEDLVRHAWEEDPHEKS